VKLSKLALVLGTTLVLILPAGGCSSKAEDKEPKVSGRDNPNLKPHGRSFGGAPAKPAGAGSQAPITKN
jgi:hypothetical protein